MDRKITSYKLNGYENGMLVISWEYAKEKEALNMYHERKNSNGYKGIEWELEKYETTVTVIETTKLN